MKVLITCPYLHRLGGVANHINGLAPYWNVDVDYFQYGKRSDKNGTNYWLVFSYIYKFIIYIFKIIIAPYDVVIVNTSLRNPQLFRDLFFIFIAILFKKKVVTFFHGFDINLASKYAKDPGVLVKLLNKSAYIYVLYSGYRKMLVKSGVTVPILLTTTKVSDDMLVQGIREHNGIVKNILFVARIEKTKGIYIALDTFKLLKKNYHDLSLIVCGDGSELDNAKKYVSKNNIQDVLFTGNIKGKNLVNYYSKGDIYILPTYFEGMATTVLEAMAFGLPVITRPVGGVNDFFVNGEMGYLVDSFDMNDYFKVIEMMIKSPNMVKRMSQTNSEYARSHFLASSVCNSIEKDLLKYCKK